jgi:hypothetical protein
MYKNIFVVFVAMQAMMFSVVASGSEIAGVVTLDISGKHGKATPAGKEAFAGVKVTLFTPAYTPVAEGLSDDKGSFVIQTTGSGDYGWLFAKAETGVGALRGIYSSGALYIDPVTDALVGAMLKNGAAPENYSTGEIEFIKPRLYELATGADFGKTGTATGSVEMLLSNEPFRLALGDMVYTYSTPGDTVEEVESLNAMIAKYFSIIPSYNEQIISKYMTDDIAIDIGGHMIAGQDIMKIIGEFNKQYKVLGWKVDCVRTQIQGDVAEVETVEKTSMVSKATGETDNAVSNYMYELVRINGDWRLRKRWEKECVPENAEILVNGSSWDWEGIRPCIGNFKKKKDVDGKTANIKSIYFARNAHGFFWRLEFEGNLFNNANNSISTLKPQNIKPTSTVTPRKELSFSFIVTLFNDMIINDLPNGVRSPINDEIHTEVHSLVGLKDGTQYSLNQVRRIAPDGFPEELVYLDNFHIAPSYVNGMISLEVLKAFEGVFFADARIVFQVDDTKSEVMSESSPIQVKAFPGSNLSP